MGYSLYRFRASCLFNWIFIWLSFKFCRKTDHIELYKIRCCCLCYNKCRNEISIEYWNSLDVWILQSPRMLVNSLLTPTHGFLSKLFDIFEVTGIFCLIKGRLWFYYFSSHTPSFAGMNWLQRFVEVLTNWHVFVYNCDQENAITHLCSAVIR